MTDRAFAFLSTGFDKVVGAAKELGQKTKDTFEEAKIGDKIKMAGSAIADTTVTAGIFLLDKTKSAASSVVEKGRELTVIR